MQVRSGPLALQCKSSEKHLECGPSNGEVCSPLLGRNPEWRNLLGTQACEMRVCLPLGEEFLRRWWMLWVE